MTHKPAGRRGATIVSNQAVFQAYVDLCGANPPVTATRQAVANSLSVPYRLVDEHTDRLLQAGKLRRVTPGVFEPTESAETRAMSFTLLPHGGAKLEVGDQVLDLHNMREGWMAYGLLDGWLKAKTQSLRKIIPPPTKE